MTKLERNLRNAVFALSAFITVTSIMMFAEAIAY